MTDAAAVPLTDALKAAIRVYYRGICQYCGADGAHQIEHFVPRSRGGADSLGNATLACEGCNSRKRARRLDPMFIAIAHARARDASNRILALVPSLRRLKLSVVVETARGDLNTLKSHATGPVIRDRPVYVYRGWCGIPFPHRAIKSGQVWEADCGGTILIADPGSGLVPYGSVGRLIMLYVQTMAVRRRSPKITFGDSWRALAKNLGYSWGGRSGGVIRHQAKLIENCAITLRPVFDKIGLFTVVEEVDDGIHSVMMCEPFYRALINDAVAVETRAVRALSSNGASLDCYLWLASCASTLAEPTIIPWTALKAQYGSPYKNMFHFRQRFVEALESAIEVYPSAKVQVTKSGLTLYPSPPPVGIYRAGDHQQAA